MKHWTIGPMLALTAAIGACQAYAPGVGPSVGPEITHRPGVAIAGRPTANRGLPGAMAKDAPAPTGEAVPHEWIVTLRAGAMPESMIPALSGLGYRSIDQLRIRERYWLRIEAPTDRGDAAERELLSSPGVTAVTRHMRVQAQQVAPVTPDDPKLAQQWSHLATELAAAWSLVPPDEQENVIVAVLDGGLDVAHEEFLDGGRIVSPRDYTRPIPGDPTTYPADVPDGNGHGTHVAGIIGAPGNNGTGIAGVAWGVKIMPFKVLYDNGGGVDFEIMKALSDAIHMPPIGEARVRVINMSLGNANDGFISQGYADLYQEAVERGIMIVAAAGNNGLEHVSSPANTPGGISVGATRDYLGRDHHVGYSHWGANLTLTAPGYDILSTIPGGYESLSGTSMATPFVAGVAALVVAKNDPGNVEANQAFWEAWYQRMTEAVDDLGPPGRDVYYGFGRINARKAVETPLEVL